MALFNVRMPKTSYGSGQNLHRQAMQGFSTVEANFRAVCEGIEQRILPDVMHDALEPTFYLSRVYVPKDTLKLMMSGYIDVVPRRGGPRAEMGYTAPYAVFVHEMTHIRHDEPTCAKYLQRAMDEDRGQILSRIAAGVKARTGM